MTGFEPFYLEHDPREFATRQPPPAQSPQYDLAYVWYGNPRIMWPVETKVLKRVDDIGGYVSDLKGNLLTCRYAPFSAEAAMLAYLLHGEPETAFSNIASAVPCVLESHSSYTTRHHRTSAHLRMPPRDRPCVPHFICNHLILELDRSRYPGPAVVDTQDNGGNQRRITG